MEKRGWYAVVTFGAPSIRYRKIHRVKRDAADLCRILKGSGTCSEARVVLCETRRAAQQADISDSPNCCGCGTVMPVVARDQTPYEFCSEECKVKYGKD